MDAQNVVKKTSEDLPNYQLSRIIPMNNIHEKNLQ